MANDDEWIEDDTADEEEGSRVIAYDISAAPNDFNVKTLVDFIEAGVIEIPPFQRHYVWDIKRASRLIESLLMGLPIPQIFLYEKGRNRFQVIDGQQRLLTVYYFLKQRFPIPSARPRLRRMLMQQPQVPSSLLNDNEYFSGFKLSLPQDSPDVPAHPLHDKDYSELDDLKTQLDLRTIRAITVRQSAPTGDDAIYEIFNRLNSGGVNLTPQEIRLSLYHSELMQALATLNFLPRWRELLGRSEADIHFKDMEVLLRATALLEKVEHYKPSMARFLNAYAYKAEKYQSIRVKYLRKLIESFFQATADLPRDAFFGQTNQFNVSIFDSVFVAVCEKAYEKDELVKRQIDSRKLNDLKRDDEFNHAAQARTTGAGNVRDRIRIARKYLGGRGR